MPGSDLVVTFSCCKYYKHNRILWGNSFGSVVKRNNSEVFMNNHFPQLNQNLFVK